MLPVSDQLSRVNAHSLPYRVIIDEIAKRRPDVLPENVHELLDKLDASRDEVAKCERYDQPDLQKYRELLKQCKETESKLQDILHHKNLNLSAICFSGGGIRSASFGLGVLTGLAELSVNGNSRSRSEERRVGKECRS